MRWWVGSQPRKLMTRIWGKSEWKDFLPYHHFSFRLPTLLSTLMQQRRPSTGSKPAAASSGTAVPSAQMKKMVGPVPLDAHHVWFYGYVAYGACALLYVLNVSLLRFPFLNNSALYTISVLSLALSLAITVGQYVRTWTPSWDTLDRVMRCDSSPYLALAFLLLTTPPCPVALLPMLVYALFHVIAFCQNDPVVSRSVQWRVKGEPIALELQKLQPAMLEVAAHLEVLTLPWLLLSFVLRRGASLMQIVGYVQFLKWQSTSIATTNSGGSERVVQAMRQWDRTIDALAKHPAAPALIKALHRHYRTSVHWLSTMRGGNVGPSTSAAFKPAGTKSD